MAGAVIDEISHAGVHLVAVDAGGVAEAMERARTEPLGTVLPTVHKTETGKVLRIPPEAGYELNEVPLPAREG
mgnify:CR=1 FL=1